MKIYLRLSEKNRIKIQKAKNTIFTPKISKKITMFPIPPFLKSAKCKCGKKASLILEDMTCICSKCVEEQFRSTNNLETKEDISIPLTMITIFRLRFEWSVNQHHWYTIFGRSFKPKNWNRFLSEIRDILLRGDMIMLDVEYKKETKEMTIY